MHCKLVVFIDYQSEGFQYLDLYRTGMNHPLYQGLFRDVFAFCNK